MSRSAGLCASILILFAASLPGWTVADAQQDAPAGGATAASPSPVAAPANPAAPAPAPGPAATYAIRPGDTLRITTLGEPNYTGLFRVGGDGVVQLRDQMVGGVEMGGITLEQAQRSLAERLSRFIKNPTVIVEIGRFTVIVTGAVRSPGQYEVEYGALVMEAVTRAGWQDAAMPPQARLPVASPGPPAGSAPDQPLPTFISPAGASLQDLEHVYLKRASSEVRTLNLRDYVEKGDLSQNVALMPGDTVAVGYMGTPPERSYRVSGAVRVPGKYWIQRLEPTRIPDALQVAGGLQDEADPQHCELIRGEARTPVDLTQLDRNPNLAGLAISPGDELFVPRFPVTIQVLGAVNKPGRYRVPEKTSFLDAATAAGGFAPDAVLQDACVLRGQPTVRVPANLEKTLRGQDMAQNLILRDGDVVFVPRRNPPGTSTSWTGIASTLSVLRWLIP